jgi:RND family efflux transporter MFP subunit
MTAALAGCAAPHAADALADNADAVAVSVAQAAITDVSATIDAGGVVQARTTAAISARIVAPVREVRVLPGDRVRKGQTLVVLDAGDLTAAARAARSAAEVAGQGAHAATADLRAADAALTLARASHDRIAGLHATRSATPQELDEAIAMLKGAEARMASAAARALQATSAIEGARATADQTAAIASFSTIAAPFDGLVTDKAVEPGNMASPGMVLLRVEDTRGFRLEVHVDESRAGQIRTGDLVPVFLGSRSVAMTGTVAEVSRAVDADARAFLVKIELPDVPGIRSGEFGKARFAGPSRHALTVPASALVRRGQLTSVFVVEHDRARVRLVNASESEILAGLSESEVVILSPPAGLTDGRRVKTGGR